MNRWATTPDEKLRAKVCALRHVAYQAPPTS
jgi:hypothetical protein